MLYDLCLEQAAADGLSLRNLLAEAALGWDAVAVEQRSSKAANRRAPGPVTPAALQAADSRLQHALQGRQRLLRHQDDSLLPHPGQLQQLSRLTFVASDAAAAAALFAPSNPATSTYDVLAVQPTTERVFIQACENLAVDIIALDLAKRLPFPLRRAPVLAAVKRGVHFELCYSPLLGPSTRTTFLKQARALCGITRGHNIIISSGAGSTEDLRPLADVLALAQLCGLSARKAEVRLVDQLNILKAGYLCQRPDQG